MRKVSIQHHATSENQITVTKHPDGIVSLSAPAEVVSDILFRALEGFGHVADAASDELTAKKYDELEAWTQAAFEQLQCD